MIILSFDQFLSNKPVMWYFFCIIIIITVVITPFQREENSLSILKYILKLQYKFHMIRKNPTSTIRYDHN